ncbi:putative RNA-directed DNA polymerase [Tanacetum coccineum]|uniref:RNA-directed DNA polymerase n=1 Tax=Tanacetum coccineum TaxID=301880 RepID=A0ABQ5GK00_9ASTR
MSENEVRPLCNSQCLLDEDGYHNSSGNGLWKVTLGSLIVARGKRESKLYMTHPKISKSIVNAHFHALVEADREENLNVFELTMEEEYIGPFDAYYREYGIQHQKTPPKTPQLNGLAERMNRTLVGRVRCLLSHAGLPASFWGEALNTTASVHIPKDERSKHDVKVFEEDLTLKDVEKAERGTIPQHNDDLIDLDLVPPKHFDSQFGDDIQNDEEHDEEQGADDVDAQEQPNLDEYVHPELPVPDMPPFLPLRRSTRRPIHRSTSLFYT